MRIKLTTREAIKVKLKPAQSIKVKDKNVYVYDPNIIGEYVSLAEDWAVKTDGLVEETDYSSKAYAIGGTGTTTNNAKYYAEQAGISEGNAATSETNAGTSATNAAASEALARDWATKMDSTVDGSDYSAKYHATNAATSASSALTSANNASGSESTAATKADLAKDWATKTDGTVDGSEYSAKYYANQSVSGANTATTQAGIATTQAGIATTKAGEAASSASSASGSASSAAASATNSTVWAEGTDAQVQALGGIHSAKGWAATIGSVYKPAGTVTFESLPTLSSTYEGYVYNVSNAFTTTSDFVEGAGKSYPAGTNVVCIDTGGSVYKWDILGGFVDLSPYRTSAAQDVIDATKASASDVAAIQANYVTTNTAQTISGQKTFSSIIRRSSTIDQSATTGEVETGSLIVYDKDGTGFAYFNASRSSTTNTNRQRVTNKNIASTANWFDLRASLTDAGNGYASIICGSGVTNYSLTYATSSTSSTYIPTMGWVNNPSASTNVVHRSGNETITGNKTFSQTSQPQVIRKNENQSMSGATSEVACTTSYRDGSNTVIATQGSYTAASSSGIYMRLGSWAGYEGITVRANWTSKQSTTVINTDTTQVTTPTEDTTSSTQIDTVGARNTKLQNYVSLSGTETISGNKDFTGTVTAVTQTAGDNSTKVATTAYVDSLVGAVHIVETGHSGTEWYRVWSDGFCEQGGTVGTGTTGGYPSYTIQLTKEYADTNFNVQVTGRYTSNTNNGTNYCSARTTNSITIRSVGYGSDWVTRGYITLS